MSSSQDGGDSQFKFTVYMNVNNSTAHYAPRHSSLFLQRGAPRCGAAVGPYRPQPTPIQMHGLKGFLAWCILVLQLCNSPPALYFVRSNSWRVLWAPIVRSGG